MNLREHLRVFSGAFGFQKRLAALDRLARFLEDADHIEVAATTQANQHHFHRAHPQVATAALGRAVHHHYVAAARLAEEHGFTRPLNTRFHPQDSNARKKAASLAQALDVAERTENDDA